MVENIYACFPFNQACRIVNHSRRRQIVANEPVAGLEDVPQAVPTTATCDIKHDFTVLVALQGKTESDVKIIEKNFKI